RGGFRWPAGTATELPCDDTSSHADDSVSVAGGDKLHPYGRPDLAAPEKMLAASRPYARCGRSETWTRAKAARRRWCGCGLQPLPVREAKPLKAGGGRSSVARS